MSRRPVNGRDSGRSGLEMEYSMGIDFHILIWLFPVVVTLHNLEEAILLPAWSQTAGPRHRPTTPFEFRFAVAVLTIAAYIVAYMCYVGGKGSWGAYLLSGYALAMFLNVFAPHLVATIVMRRYTPGVVTACLLNQPVMGLILYYSIAHGFVQIGRFVYWGPAVVLSLLISIPILFFLGRKVEGAGAG